MAKEKVDRQISLTRDSLCGKNGKISQSHPWPRSAISSRFPMENHMSSAMHVGITQAECFPKCGSVAGEGSDR